LQLLIPAKNNPETISYQVRKMPSKSKLDLVGVSWPVCLLKFNCALNQLCTCDVLDVTARDPDVVENIIMIANRSGNALIKQGLEGDTYRLTIEKRA
jgi:TusA-related sulfurtransferase